MLLSNTLSTLWGIASFTSASVMHDGSSCHVYPETATSSSSTTTLDDTPSILKAFSLCGTNGSIILSNDTFHIGQIMNTTNLLNTQVSILGNLIWSSNISYWLSHSLPVTYSNLSTAWLFGGINVSLLGHGVGRFDGQGQLWYDQNGNRSNEPGRPIAITFFNATNLTVDGLSWHQAQFWHSFISHSQNVRMTNIYMNSSSNSSNTTVNTDGTDTWNSRDVYFANWYVKNGDDCIGVKGNSSNIFGKNITCHGSGSMPIGSVGSDATMPDYVENVFFEDVKLFHSSNAAWIKTYKGAPGGYVRNVTWKDVVMEDVNQPIYVTQCIYAATDTGCDESELRISDITWQNITGTSRYDVAASIHCSAKAPCPGLKFIDVNITSVNASKGLSSRKEQYFCANIVGQNATGANSTGIPCTGFAQSNFPQQLQKNY